MADRKVRLFVALQVAIPALLLLNRIVSDRVEWYGWGWQMYSF